MVKVGEEYIVKIDGINSQGQGIAHIGGFVVFVDYALPEEIVRIRIHTAKKDYAIGSIVEFVERNSHGVEPPCEFFYECGGCHLMHVTYEYQLELKKKIIEDALRRIGKIERDINSVIGMENPYRYRNKAKIFVGNRKGSIVLGFYKPQTHCIVDVSKCIVQHEDIDRVIETTKEAVKNFHINVYDEILHKGSLRSIVVRRSYAFNELMLTLVSDGLISDAKEIAKFFKYNLKNLASFYINVNSKEMNEIFGEETIKDKIGEFIFEISPISFFQTNTIQTELLYNKVLEYLIPESKLVFDAYCGVGTISLFLSQKAEKVYGIEIERSAVDDAWKNAKKNNVENVEFIWDRSEEAIPRLISEGKIPDIIVVDPPRKGCDKILLDAIIENKIKQIIYISCYPATLARDINILVNSGYEIMEIQPVDMFPQTFHVECVTLMSKVEK
ncbi:MAG: 23S rRNA (uracil(1939)-C(5))-methyltransferase RlmD [Dictyoglomaceae bacterium]